MRASASRKGEEFERLKLENIRPTCIACAEEYELKDIEPFCTERCKHLSIWNEGGQWWVYCPTCLLNHASSQLFSRSAQSHIPQCPLFINERFEVKGSAGDGYQKCGMERATFSYYQRRNISLLFTSSN